MKKTFLFLTLIITCLLISSIGFADAFNFTELTERIEKLENRNQELENRIQILNESVQSNTQRIGILESLVSGLQSVVQSIQNILFNAGTCTAECNSCQNKCIGNIRYFGGSCNLTSCSCYYSSTENCDDEDKWYNTTNTRWVNDTPSTEKEQMQQEFRDYACSQLVTCTYNVTNNQWIDTGATRNKTTQYCPASTNGYSFEYITNVNITLPNSSYSFCNSGNKIFSGSSTYCDFTNTTLATLSAGNQYTLCVGVRTAAAYSESLKAWIDFNNDKNFSSYEGINIVSTIFSGNRTFTKNFTVPINAAIGETRMRVYLKYGSAYPLPCENTSYGEVEDYKIRIS